MVCPVLGGKSGASERGRERVVSVRVIDVSFGALAAFGHMWCDRPTWCYSHFLVYAPCPSLCRVGFCKHSPRAVWPCDLPLCAIPQHYALPTCNTMCKLSNRKLSNVSASCSTLYILALTCMGRAICLTFCRQIISDSLCIPSPWCIILVSNPFYLTFASKYHSHGHGPTQWWKARWG